MHIENTGQDTTMKLWKAWSQLRPVSNRRWRCHPLWSPSSFAGQYSQPTRRCKQRAQQECESDPVTHMTRDCWNQQVGEDSSRSIQQLAIFDSTNKTRRENTSNDVGKNKKTHPTTCLQSLHHYSQSHCIALGAIDGCLRDKWDGYNPIHARRKGRGWLKSHKTGDIHVPCGCLGGQKLSGCQKHRRRFWTAMCVHRKWSAVQGCWGVDWVDPKGGFESCFALVGFRHMYIPYAPKPY